MAQRSPSNPRYQRDAKIGSTRKSAASAKPKRGVGERDKVDGGDKKKAKKGTKKERGSGFVQQVSTPEIKALRKRWWVFMGIALGSAGVLMIPAVQGNSIITSIAVGAWAASFATALYIDWGKIRKLRKAEIERRKGAKS